MFRFDAAFRSELRADWPVLMIAFSCLLFGFSAPAFALPFLFTEVIDEFGWTREQATLLASAKYLTGAVSALLVGRFLDVTGLRMALIATLGLGGAALVGLMFVQGLPAYYLAGVMMGLAGPGAMVAVKVLVSRTFDASQGTATGIALLGTSLGSVLVPPIIALLIGELGWRLGFACLSIGIWIIAMPMLLFFFPKGARGPAPQTQVGDASTHEGFGEMMALFRSPQFYLLAAGLFIGAAVDQAFIQHQVLILNDLNMDRGTAALAVSAIGVVGIFCRVLVGNIVDGKSNKGVSFLYMTLTGSALLAFYLVSPIALIAFVVLRAVSHAAVLVDANVLCKHVFGLRNFGMKLGTFTAIVSLGFATGPWIAGRLFDTYGNYNAAFILFAILPLIGAALIWFLKPKYWLAARATAAAQAAPGSVPA